ncbi:hypothetical protein BU26DRAFT_517355 [Trematosphaeria pertusa]|uniref:Uncharacterized protein n=1 Tax=Trematosphaeria pertusa TaxID=390896 RepID=A0A6A6IJD4_9PLEO|nr:uncharacterized protein BU26DRAFT_517355 [Trematosphaeria pertusa]KAF2250521.1 hypothetical protein BU26DRAFT_517355 [Trematosphaeria pertusa]
MVTASRPPRASLNVRLMLTVPFTSAACEGELVSVAVRYTCRIDIAMSKRRLSGG